MSRRNKMEPDKIFYVYILESLKEENHFYVGLTENLGKRLKEHNYGNKTHASKFIPWKIITAFAFDDKKRAENFEIYLK